MRRVKALVRVYGIGQLTISTLSVKPAASSLVSRYFQILNLAYTNEDGRKYGKRSKKLDSLYKTIALGRVIVVKWGNQATKVYEWRKNARESYI